jgi:hypothetical protein
LLAIALLAAILHGVGIARSPLPAQDGLKFLRVARDFHRKPWIEAIRGSDQHPLYPAMIAAVQPLVALVVKHAGESWRLSAQFVSALASLATLLPLYLLTRRIFDGPKAAMSCLLFVLLPLPTALGHETLSDAVALLWFTSTLALGIEAAHSRSLVAAIFCGVTAGLGYLTRPELAIAPVAIVCWILASAWRDCRGLVGLRHDHEFQPVVRTGPPGPITSGFNPIQHSNPKAGFDLADDHGFQPVVRTEPPGPITSGFNPIRPPAPRALNLGSLTRIGALSVSFLFLVGTYALLKGEVSEKLALRRSAASTIQDGTSLPKKNRTLTRRAVTKTQYFCSARDGLSPWA